MTTEHKNEYLEKLETLVNGTRAALDAEATKISPEELDLQVQIEALKADLLGLPGQAKALRNQGFVKQSRDITDQIEELNIKIARLQVEMAQIAADRAAEVSRKFLAIVPEVLRLSGEGSRMAAEAKRQAQLDFEALITYGGIERYAFGIYGQPAGEAQRRLHEAQTRLNQAIQGSPVPAA